MAQTRVKSTPLPRRQMAVVSLLQLSDAFSVHVIWSFAPFMVEDLGISEGEIGSHVGMLATIYFLCQLFSTLAWSWFAEQYSKQLAFSLGALGVSVSMVMFGFSVSYEMAFLARALSGLLNGNVAVVKTYLAEITDSTNEALGFSVLALTWGVGSITAPALGGFLSQPQTNYPDTFSHPFFAKFPYALPCLASALLSVCASASAFFCLRDPHARSRKRKRGNQSAVQMSDVEMVTVSETASPESVEQIAVGSKQEQDAADGPTDTHTMVHQSPVPPPRSPDTTSLLPDHTRSDQRKSKASRLTVPDTQDATSALDTQGGWARLHGRATRRLPWLSWPVGLAALAYASLGTAFIIYDEMFSVLAKSGVGNHGFGFTTTNVGTALMISGAMLFSFQMLVFPHIAKRFRYTTLLICGAACGIPLFVSFAFLTAVAEDRTTLWGLLVAFTAMKTVVGATQFTSAFLIIATITTSHTRGYANGLAQSLVALGRAIGPYIGGMLWNRSLTMTGEFSHVMVYLTIAFFQMCTCSCGVGIWWHLVHKKNMDIREVQESS